MLITHALWCSSLPVIASETPRVRPPGKPWRGRVVRCVASELLGEPPSTATKGCHYHSSPASVVVSVPETRIAAEFRAVGHIHVAESLVPG